MHLSAVVLRRLWIVNVVSITITGYLMASGDFIVSLPALKQRTKVFFSVYTIVIVTNHILWFSNVE